ncbi:peroxide stress protein YaaA [Ideonella livida]|uniref:UPF0246 protein G3A44_09725 n=1 Tax=Ideonella livida TaxID=2707176 RepID=A0A7C9TLA7_9BURK|nr:peroxide stress protein YaaA [Ideonella livida]NDY91467.1 peroxide stress protein YaaA [Ideonella livida]
MLALLSPAKSLDYETPLDPAVEALATRPDFVDEAEALIEQLRGLSVQEVARLMSLSDKLAQLNVARYGVWSRRFTNANSRPAALAFNGDVYEGLAAGSLTVDDLTWAQEHVAILSGLYGVLRPLDRLQPYRLEMGTRLACPGAADLYGYWSGRLVPWLQKRLTARRGAVLVNLASQEYFRAVDRKALQARVVECQFQEWHGGQWKIISFHAKRARGLMARHLITQRIDHPDGLDGFEAEGYRFAPQASSADLRMFRRGG